MCMCGGGGGGGDEGESAPCFSIMCLIFTTPYATNRLGMCIFSVNKKSEGGSGDEERAHL